jgi:peptidoglycan hydrolase-like protein with peptidoglycan-binding domain
VYAGPISGELNAPTETALRHYQEKQGLPASGAADAATLQQLQIGPVTRTLAQTPPGHWGANSQNPHPCVWEMPHQTEEFGAFQAIRHQCQRWDRASVNMAVLPDDKRRELWNTM